MRIFAEQAQFPGAAGHALLLSSALVAGAGLLRPLTVAPVPGARRLVRLAAGGAVVLAAVGLVAFGASLLVVAAHVVVVLGTAWSQPRRVAGACGGAVLTAVLVLETAVRPSIVDLPLAPAYLVALVVVLGAGVASWTVPPRRLLPVSMVAVVVAGGFGVANALAPQRDQRAAGVPVLAAVHAAGGHVPVLIVPGRPGQNLVQVGGDAAVSVGTSADHPVPAAERPGAGGRWAVVDLPAGPSRVWISGVPVDVDTGPRPPNGPPSPAAITGPDGPECASAALGAALGGSRQPLTACPADSLAPSDADSLRGLVTVLAGRGVHDIRVAADESARSVAAAAVLRDAARASGLTLTEGAAPGSALVVVSGWAAATATLSDVAARQRTEVIHSPGTYLAPWLLSAPILRAGNGAVLPLPFNPRDDAPVRYQLALDALHGLDGLHGAAPTTSGYRAWLAAQALPQPTATRLYAASPVAAMPQEFAHPTHDGGWLPGGTIVPVSG